MLFLHGGKAKKSVDCTQWITKKYDAKNVKNNALGGLNGRNL